MQASAIDIDSATRLAWKYMMDSGDLLKGPAARQAFLDFLELMSASHPIPKYLPAAIHAKCRGLSPPAAQGILLLQH